MSVLKLVDLLKKEKDLMRTVTSLGLERSESLKVLSHSAVATAQKDGGVTDGLFDASDRTEGGGVIVWWNDLEKDKRYFLPSVYTLLVELTKSCQLREMESLFVQCMCFCIPRHHAVSFMQCKSAPPTYVSRLFPERQAQPLQHCPRHGSFTKF